MTARALMVAGTSSWAGKSLLTTAICASLRRRGIDVAPFKAQNMSNNARVVDGGEIGAAQYFQALAAGVTPSVQHNPVLLKPEADTRSQVVVLGAVDPVLTETPWRQRSSVLWPVIASAYDDLAARHDLIVIEGAGSPAEINLVESDLANIGIARHSDAATLLVCDIDRGGAFAHLFGTWAMLPTDADRGRVRGFVLNKFRGDAALLSPGPQMLQARTGVPTVGVVPMFAHGLPDEDGADPRATYAGPRKIRVVRGPAASNLDEWHSLRATSQFAWATQPDQLRDADLIILPGSKLVAADLDWARAIGMDEAIFAAHRRRVPILAVCGGFQLLGGALSDPHGVERPTHGLDILPAQTVLSSGKTVRRTQASFGRDLAGPWQALAGRPVEGYEVRFGHTATSAQIALESDDGPLGYVQDNVLAVYLHGVAEDPDVVEILTGRRPAVTLEATFEQLADVIDEHVDLARVLPH